MAFVARQNSLTFDGTDTSESCNLKILRLAIKTIQDAAEAEKTAHNRGSAYWFLDPNRLNGGSYPSEDGGADSAIYELSSSSKAVGVFFKNADSETLFLFVDIANYLSIGSSKGSSGIYVYVIQGDVNYSNDNSQVTDWNGLHKQYGFGLAVSKSDFGGLNTPWTSGFFSDGDLKPIADQCASAGFSAYANGATADFIVCIDGKKILIDRRMSYNGKRDQLCGYGDFIAPYDNSDLQKDVIFTFHQDADVTSRRFFTVFRDKAGSTSYNPNGSNWAFVRKTQMNVNQTMINGSNSNNIPYTGISFGWQSCDYNVPNTVLNADGRGYKGLSDTNYLRVLTADSMIENKVLYNNNLFIIAQFRNAIVAFSIGIPWDASNPTINQ